MAMAGISANRLELLQIADAVAREKTIDKKIVIEAMEDAIQKAAKSRYGAENDIRCEIDPKTGELVQGDISAQTDRALDNLAAVLEAAGCAFGDVVKTTIYLVDLNDFQVVNATYGKRFTSAPPARATIQVSALPKGARVEIDAIAKKRA